MVGSRSRGVLGVGNSRSLRANWIRSSEFQRSLGKGMLSPQNAAQPCRGHSQAGGVRQGGGLLLTAVAFSITAEIGAIFVGVWRW